MSDKWSDISKGKVFAFLCKDCGKILFGQSTNIDCFDSGTAKDIRRYQKKGYDLYLVKNVSVDNWCRCGKKGAK